jgi:hypothetical protein
VQFVAFASRKDKPRAIKTSARDKRTSPVDDADLLQGFALIFEELFDFTISKYFLFA